jgi:hypothetical protein
VRRPPSDFKLLKTINEWHRTDYLSRMDCAAAGSAAMLPIDIPAIAASLGTNEHIVFGRLYHHLDQEYGEPRREGQPRKAFFLPKAGSETNCVNFPLLEAVLAALWVRHRRDLWACWTAAFSLALSVASLIVSIAS